MPSGRRVKTGLIFILFSILIVIYVSTSASETRASRFYTSTKDALSQREHHESSLKHVLDEDAHKQALLSDTGEDAKIGGIESSHDSVEPNAAHGIASPAGSDAAREEMDETGEDGVAKQVARPGTDPMIVKAKEKVEKQREQEKETETKEEANAEDELNYILKRSPIIIFSKTYCPFSKKAKTILLQKYKIEPAPYVVELDTHRIGKDLQAQLSKITGRNTVPNIFVNGVSIGGGDEVEGLHASHKLIEKVTGLAGQRVSMKPR